MSFRVLSVALWAAVTLAGCATLEHGTLDDVPVATVPSGARVWSSTGTNCISPCTVAAPRKETAVIMVSKPGYVTQTLVSEAKPDQAAIDAASTLVPTPDIVGRAVDVQDGSYYRHVPKAFAVTLAPAS